MHHVVCLTGPGCDRHEAVVERRHLHPDRWRSAAYLRYGRARSNVRHTHSHAPTHALKGNRYFFFSYQLSLPFCLGSEKLTCCFLVTPTCKGLSQSGGATGSWGNLRWGTKASRYSCKLPFSACFPFSVTPLHWAEMWKLSRRSRREWMFYLLAGTNMDRCMDGDICVLHWW